MTYSGSKCSFLTKIKLSRKWLKFCRWLDICPMSLYSKFQPPGWSGTIWAEKILIWKNLPSKSPRFLPFFKDCAFTAIRGIFRQSSRKQTPSNFCFYFWKHVSQPHWGHRRLSGSLQKLTCPQFFSFWLHQTTQTQCYATIKLQRAWKVLPHWIYFI